MKTKSSLLIKGITQEQKDFLYQYAQENLGTRSRTQAVLDLINEKMQSNETQKKAIFERKKQANGRKRLQLSLLENDYNCLKQVADKTDSSMQHYLIKLLIMDLYGERLLSGEEYEILRKSNYELHKIGVNVNQIAKAINEGEKRKLQIQTLAKHIESHVEIVKKILNASYNKY